MKRIIILVVIGVLGLGCLGYSEYINAVSNPDFGWYDEDIRIGWNPVDEWYYVCGEIDNKGMDMRHTIYLEMTDGKKVTHLSKEVRDYLIGQGRRLP